MRIQLHVAWIALVLGAACHSADPAPSTPVPHSLRLEVEAANEGLEQSFRSGDLTAVARFYGEHAFVAGPGGVAAQGQAEIDAYWGLFGDPIDWQLEVLGLEGRGDVAVQRGRSHLRYQRDGEEHLSVVEFVLVWGRAPGGELVILGDAYW